MQVVDFFFEFLLFHQKIFRNNADMLLDIMTMYLNIMLDIYHWWLILTPHNLRRCDVIYFIVCFSDDLHENCL